MSIALAESEVLGVDLPGLALVRQLFEKLMQSGYAMPTTAHKGCFNFTALANSCHAQYQPASRRIAA